jgi:hypothetical protein
MGNPTRAHRLTPWIADKDIAIPPKWGMRLFFLRATKICKIINNQTIHPAGHSFTSVQSAMKEKTCEKEVRNGKH